MMHMLRCIWTLALVKSSSESDGASPSWIPFEESIEFDYADSLEPEPVFPPTPFITREPVFEDFFGNGGDLPTYAKAIVLMLVIQNPRESSASITQYIEAAHIFSQLVSLSAVERYRYDLFSPMTCSRDFHQIVSLSVPGTFTSLLRQSGFSDHQRKMLYRASIWERYCTSALYLSPPPCEYREKEVKGKLMKGWAMTESGIQRYLQDQLRDLH